jgi:hypothetical protein
MSTALLSSPVRRLPISRYILFLLYAFYYIVLSHSLSTIKTINKNNLTAIVFLLFTFLNANGQTTITLQPNASLGNDALLHGLSSQVNVNYGHNPQLAAGALTFGGVPGIIRNVLDFDLYSIPNGAIINSAYLSLYAWDSNTGLGQHSTFSGSNKSLLQRITSTWNESSITWNNQLTTTTANQIYLPASTSTTQNYLNIDVSNLVQDMTNNPSTSFVFLLRLQNESYYRRLNFASSDHNNSGLHPKLVISYTIASSLSKNQIPTFEFNLFPNPASSLLTVNLNKIQQEKVFLQIINSTGQLIKQTLDIQQTISIDISDYPEELYFLKLVSTKKVIFQ